MRAVIQRVTQAQVTVDDQTIAAIGDGLVILLGIENEDTREKADQLCKKIAALRIFSDAEEKMNLSVRDISGSAIVVSQFTLMADTRKGNRPSFFKAAPPDIASPLRPHPIRPVRRPHAGGDPQQRPCHHPAGSLKRSDLTQQIPQFLRI
jgi:D-tyrosyl-tRNA(Tyr) deacylase